MNRMKHQTLVLIVLFGISVNFVSAQTVADGFRFLEHKEYQKSQEIFENLLKSNPQNIDALFGLGEVYFETGKTDLAKEMYSKGIGIKETGINLAGLGKVALRNGQQIEAETHFKNALKKAKKDGRIAESIARNYFILEQYDKADKYANMAIEADPKLPNVHFIKGIISLKNKSVSEAAKQFDRVLYFDPSRLEAYLYQAEIMEAARNPSRAIEFLSKAIDIDPKFGKAHKQLAELYYNAKKYEESITYFDKYFQNVPDDKDKTHYAYSLFFTRQFETASSIITELYNSDPNNFVLVRLLGYISLETKDYDNGKTYMEKVFKLTPPDKLLTDDYIQYGRALAATGNDSLAVINFEKAVEIDPTNFQVYDDLAKSYLKLNDIDKFLVYSKKFLTSKPEIVSLDYFTLGRSLYSAAQSTMNTDSIKGIELYMEADSMFQQVEIRSPNSHLGPFWRARCQWGIDKDMSLGLANPFYEKALEVVISTPDKNKSEIMEIYRYFGFYFYLKSDRENSIVYWKKLLAIDPENAIAKEALEGLSK